MAQGTTQSHRFNIQQAKQKQDVFLDQNLFRSLPVPSSALLLPTGTRSPAKDLSLVPRVLLVYSKSLPQSTSCDLRLDTKNLRL